MAKRDFGYFFDILHNSTNLTSDHANRFCGGKALVWNSGVSRRTFCIHGEKIFYIENNVIWIFTIRFQHLSFVEVCTQKSSRSWRLKSWLLRSWLLEFWAISVGENGQLVYLATERVCSQGGSLEVT